MISSELDMAGTLSNESDMAARSWTQTSPNTSKMKHASKKRQSGMPDRVISVQIMYLRMCRSLKSFVDAESNADDSLNLLVVHCCAQDTSIQDCGSIYHASESYVSDMDV
jgi:hypothetical protein